MGIHLAARPASAPPRAPTFSIDPACLGHGRWVRRSLTLAALSLVGVGLLFSAAQPRPEPGPPALESAIPGVTFERGPVGPSGYDR